MRTNYKFFWRVFITCFVFLVAASGSGLMRTAVKSEAASVKLNRTKASISEKKTVTLSVNKPTSKVKWKSSNSSVVKIKKTSGPKKKKAVLVGVKGGTATITAKVGKKSLRAKLTVKHNFNYKRRTCSNPDTCACGATRGKTLPHSWVEATCQKAKHCSVCKLEEGGLGSHRHVDGICSLCGDLDLKYFVVIRLANEGNMSNNLTLSVNYTRRLSTEDEFVIGTTAVGSYRDYACLLSTNQNAQLFVNGASSYFQRMQLGIQTVVYRFPTTKEIPFKSQVEFFLEFRKGIYKVIADAEGIVSYVKVG